MPIPDLRRPYTFFLPPPLLFRASRRSSFPHSTPLFTRPATCACLQSTNPPAQYVPLHVHSDFSLLDGASQLPSLVERASKLGVPAFALTDHGVLYGAIQLIKACTSSGVKPIIGNEMYIVNDGFQEKLKVGDDGKPAKPPKKYHLIVLAKNTTGYRNLVKLTTIAHLHGKVGKGIFARPCINKALLYQYKEGLMVSSACLGGEVPQAILNNDLEAARTVATWYRDVFGDDYYLEIQDHGSAEDKKVNPVMIQLSKELGVKVIATNDSHFTSCLDAEAHDALVCIQTGKLLTDENRLHYAGNEYFKSVEEMRQCFIGHLAGEDIDQALLNTMQVADKVDEYDLFGATRIPDFPVPPGFNDSHDVYLKYIARKSLRDRLEARQKSGLADKMHQDQYFERLEFELDMISKMGFSSYFLVVWDYVKYAKEQDIPVGPGRGSAAGSLAAFALRITDVDPIPFNLLFERFLNPERKSMPDIDTDFSVEGRDKVISYVSARYGIDRVAQIITFNRLTSKAVLKDVARVHSVPYSEADRLAKLIPVVRGKPATLTEMLSAKSPSPEFRKAIEGTPSHRAWIDKAQRLEGANKTYGIHAAGVVISSSPLTEIVPLSKAKHGETITQYAMEDVEALGLLKMDFLGLKNLTVIETALRFINEGRKQRGLEEALDFSVDALPLNDAKTYQLLAEGELDGIFQLDASGGMRNIVRELRPSSLEDISSILALYRPGPLDAGLIPKFIRRKHGIDPIEYDHPLLEPILKETYGIMVYQEQIMRIARDLAGYSLGQADILRRAMGKKKTAIMEKERPRFISGAQGKGIPNEKAEELFDMMSKFAEYCFNKSHSTAYAYLTYQTAYLKANYPVEYSAALLRSNMNQSDKLIRYLADANILGVRVNPPSVNKSELGFTVDRSEDKKGVVLFGLEAVKTVGESVGKALLEERNAHGPFKNIVDLIERVDLRVLNKRAMGALIQAGAFDELHPNRKVLFDYLDGLLVLRRKLRDKKKRRERKLQTEDEERMAAEEDVMRWEEMEIQLAKDSEDLPDFSSLQRFSREKATLGFYASGHPLSEFRQIGNHLGCTRTDHIIGDDSDDSRSQDEDSAVMFSSLPDGSEVMILSCITDLKRITTAKGKNMTKWTVEDTYGRIPGVVFPTANEIAQQRVSASNLVETTAISSAIGSESEADETNSNANLPQVVEEDARVIVWGKVDKESSGTVQIVIDDVQRIEDVKVIVATASYDSSRSPSTHLYILRHMAARILEVDLSQLGFKSYVDANGETRKRRWTKAVPLSKKNRIPLVLQCLDEHGQVIQAMNAGNNLRFPEDCLDLLEPLAANTGLQVELLSVSRDILENQDILKPTLNLTFSNSSGEGEESKFQGSGPSANESVSEKVDFAQSVRPAGHEEVGSGIAAVTNNEKIRTDHDLLEESQPVEKESEEVSDDPGIKVKGMSFIQPEHGKVNSRLRWNDTREVKETTAIPLFESKAEKALLLSTHYGRQMYAKYVTESEANMVQEGNDSFGIVGSGGAGASVATVPRTKSVTSVVSSYASDITSSSSSTNVSTIAPEVEDIISHKGSTDEDIRDLSEQTFGSRGPVESNGTAAEVRSNQNLKNWKGPQSGDELGCKSSDSNSGLSADILYGNGASTSLKASGAFRTGELFADELQVDFDEVGLAGVMDAVSFIGGQVATRQIESKSSVCGMSGLDLSKLIEEEVSLRIEGHMVYTRGDLIYVLVNVKEGTPSGKRKRVRSFGPVICLFKANVTLDGVLIKTKKAKKEVEAVRQRLEKAREDVAVEVSTDDATAKASKRRRKRVARSSEADFMVKSDSGGLLSRSSLVDGGELVAAMSRAAGVCLDRGLGLVQSARVVALDGLMVDDADMLGEASSLRIHVHLEGLFFGTGKVQVEAIIVNTVGHSTSCKASFRVSVAKQMGQSALSVLADKDVLFEGSSMSDWFAEVYGNLPQ